MFIKKSIGGVFLFKFVYIANKKRREKNKKHINECYLNISGCVFFLNQGRIERERERGTKRKIDGIMLKNLI